MRGFKKYGLYFLIIILLLASIGYLVLKNSGKIGNISNKKTEIHNEVGMVSVDGTFEKMTGIYGKVLAWQPLGGGIKIKLDDDGTIEDYLIDPTVTTVMVPEALKNVVSDQLHILKKASGYQWESAFCVGELFPKFVALSRA